MSLKWGWTYTLESSLSPLGPWSDSGNSFLATGVTSTFDVNRTGEATAFFRVRVNP